MRWFSWIETKYEPIEEINQDDGTEEEFVPIVMKMNGPIAAIGNSVFDIRRLILAYRAENDKNGDLILVFDQKIRLYLDTQNEEEADEILDFIWREKEKSEIEA